MYYISLTGTVLASPNCAGRRSKMKNKANIVQENIDKFNIHAFQPAYGGGHRQRPKALRP
jgi:hypothetical protein